MYQEKKKKKERIYTTSNNGGCKYSARPPQSTDFIRLYDSHPSSGSSDRVALRSAPPPHSPRLPSVPSLPFPHPIGSGWTGCVSVYYYYNAVESKDRCWVHPWCHTRTHSRPIRPKKQWRGLGIKKKKKKGNTYIKEHFVWVNRDKDKSVYDWTKYMSDKYKFHFIMSLKVINWKPVTWKLTTLRFHTIGLFNKLHIYYDTTYLEHLKTLFNINFNKNKYIITNING